MAFTVVSSIGSSLSNATGRSGQGRIHYAANQGKYWAFWIGPNATPNPFNAAYSTDGSSWTTPAGSPFSLPLATANQTMGWASAYANIASTDVIHVVMIGASTLFSYRFTLGSTWTNTYDGENASESLGTYEIAHNAYVVKMALDSTYEPAIFTSPDGNLYSRQANNVDSGTSWTSGFASAVMMFNNSTQYSYSADMVPLGVGDMLAITDNGPIITPGYTRLYSITRTSGTWSGLAGTPATAVLTQTAPGNWGMIDRTSSDIHLISLSDNVSAFTHRRFNGSTWSAGDTIGTLTLATESNIRLVTDGTSVWAGAIDTSNNIKTNKWTSGGGWAGWTTLEAARTNTPSNIVGCYNGTDNIMWMWTESTGSDFNIVGANLAVGGTPPPPASGIGLGKTGMMPASTPGPPLSGWQWSSVPGPWWAAFLRNVQNDPVSPYNTAWHNLMASIGLGSTMRTSFYGPNPDSVGNQGNIIVGMPVNHVAGTTPLVAATIGTYVADSDVGPYPMTQTMSIEAWPFSCAQHSDIFVASGSPNVTGIPGTTHFRTFLQSGDQVVLGIDPSRVNKLYTIGSIIGDTALTLTSNYSETTLANDQLFGPYNRPPTIDQFLSGADTRALLLVRNETTGLPDHYWEMLYPSYSGTTWAADGAFFFDMVSGLQRQDGKTGSCTGGTPAMPLLFTYDECLAGSVNHPLRCAIHTDLGLPSRCIWPCTHAAAAFGLPNFVSGYLPCGSVLRLNSNWIDANLADFPDIVKPVVVAAGKYGLHVNDYTTGTPFEIDLSQDSRWNKLDLESLWLIPTNAFELVDSIRPQYTLSTSPAPYATGNQITFTVKYVESGNTNIGAVRVYILGSINGGTATQLGAGSVFVDLSNSVRSGTTTFTPSSTGNYLFSTYQASNVWWLEGAAVPASISTAARNLTTTQAGRWDDPLTWGNKTPPAPGDKAIVNHDVTVVGDATIGDGTASTVLTCTSGSLTVVGCAFTIRGNALFGQYNLRNITNRLSVIGSAGNSASLILDGNSGVTPTVSMAADTQSTFIGYSGYRVSCQTKAGTSGNPGQIAAAAFGTCGYMIASYCDFARLGDGSHIGIDAPYVQDLASGTPFFTWDHCTVNSCGRTPNLIIRDSTPVCSFTSCDWTNPVGDFTTVFSAISSARLTTGTRLVSGCRFFGDDSIQPYWDGPTDWTIISNYFGGSLQGNRAQLTWTSFDGNFIRNPNRAESVTAGDCTWNFWLADIPAGGYMPMQHLGWHDATISYNIYQYVGVLSESSNAMNGNEGAGADHTFTITNNIILPNGSGTSFGLGGFNANTSQPTTRPLYRVEHNTVCVGDIDGANIGVTVGQCSGTILSWKSNVFWRATTALSTSYAFTNYDPSPVVNVVAAGNVTNNCNYHLATVPSGHWSGTSGDTNHESGTPYNAPFSGNVTPGANDISVNPQFTNTTRDLLTWDASLGGSGTLSTALARIQSNTALTKSSLIPWVRAGFFPTNLALSGTAHDGGTIGAVQVASIPPSSPLFYTFIHLIGNSFSFIRSYVFGE